MGHFRDGGQLMHFIKGLLAGLLAIALLGAPGIGAIGVSFQPAPMAVLATLSFISSATSSTSTITVPGTAAAGDIAVLFDAPNQSTTPTTVIPSGFIDFVDGGSASQSNDRVSVKVLDGTETTLTGMNGGSSNSKLLLIFRPSHPVSAINHATSTVSKSGSSDPTGLSVGTDTIVIPSVMLVFCAASGGVSAITSSPSLTTTIVANFARGGYILQTVPAALSSLGATMTGTSKTTIAFLLWAS